MRTGGASSPKRLMSLREMGAVDGTILNVGTPYIVKSNMVYR